MAIIGSDENSNYEPEHVAIERSMGGRALNLGHGSACDHCNDAVLEGMESNMGRLASLKFGILESKFEKGKWK